MSVESEIRKLAAGIAQKRPYIRGEESTKDALIRPMIRALGYDTWNPAEVSSEFTADFGTRQHEKVDFAILAGGRPVILIECKTISSRLGNNEIAQLFRYFSATDASFAILTNGVRWRFFTDLQTPNRMDTEPFLDVNLEHLDDFHLAELMRFARGNFDEQAIRANIQNTRVMNAIFEVIDAELLSPSDDFVRFFARKVYAGRMSSKAVAYFRPYVEDGLQLHLDLFLEDALQEEDAQPGPGQVQVGSGPDFDMYADYVKADEGTKSLFAELRHMLESIGTDVELAVRKSRISFLRAGGQRERVFVAIHVRKQYLQVYLKVDPQTVALSEGFTNDVRDKFTPCGAPLLVMVRNSADLERAKPLLERSYRETG